MSFTNNNENKELLTLLAYLLIDHAKRQMSRGRSGPSEFDLDSVIAGIQSGKIVIKLINGNPVYPELQFCP